MSNTMKAEALKKLEELEEAASFLKKKRKGAN